MSASPALVGYAFVSRNFVERSMARDTPPDKRDLRDWDEIAAWARAIAAELHRG